MSMDALLANMQAQALARAIRITDHAREEAASTCIHYSLCTNPA